MKKTIIKNILLKLSIFTFMLSMGLAVQAQVTPAEQVNETITFKVKGIQCGGDLPIINKNVAKLEGVQNCEAVGDVKPTTSFTVTYQPDQISFEKIVEAVEESPSCDFPDQKPYRVKK